MFLTTKSNQSQEGEKGNLEWESDTVSLQEVLEFKESGKF